MCNWYIVDVISRKRKEDLLNTLSFLKKDLSIHWSQYTICISHLIDLNALQCSMFKVGYQTKESSLLN